jgi:hypothetical protein
MSSNSENKSRPTINSEGRNIINKVLQFLDQEKSRENLKFPIENATSRGAAATGKQKQLCKI